MEKEMKPCPYCGEEIMAVAKKCKHCGEWLDSDITSAATQHATQQNITSHIPVDFRREFNPFQTMPVTIPLFALVAWIGGLYWGLYQLITEGILGLYDTASCAMLPYFSLVGVTALLFIGFRYSKNLKIPTKTIATFRTWTAFSASFAWVFLWRTIASLTHSGIFMTVGLFIMLIIPIVLWCYMKFRLKPSLKESVVWFSYTTYAAVILLCIAVVISNQNLFLF